jgi:hypothetical protein
VPQLIAALVVVLSAVVAAAVLRRRRRPDVPTQPRYEVPRQLDRADFPDVAVPWLVAVFSSASCAACADVARKCAVLASREVAVAEVEYSAAGQLHGKYDIQAVPMVVVADREGVVRAVFIGPVTATDLWAAVAEARQPGSSPEPDLGR